MFKNIMQSTADNSIDITTARHGTVMFGVAADATGNISKFLRSRDTSLDADNSTLAIPK